MAMHPFSFFYRFRLIFGYAKLQHRLKLLSLPFPSVPSFVSFRSVCETLRSLTGAARDVSRILISFRATVDQVILILLYAGFGAINISFEEISCPLFGIFW